VLRLRSYTTTSENSLKIGVLEGTGSVCPNFHVQGVDPHQPFFLYTVNQQACRMCKTRAIRERRPLARQICLYPESVVSGWLPKSNGDFLVQHRMVTFHEAPISFFTDKSQVVEKCLISQCSKMLKNCIDPDHGGVWSGNLGGGLAHGEREPIVEVWGLCL